MVFMALIMVITACSGGSSGNTKASEAPNIATPKPNDAKQKLVIYTARDKNVFDVVLPKFKEKYPNIEVEILEMGAQQILERARGEKANPQGDF
jgi:iron(III) transport system substrate-binding protein